MSKIVETSKYQTKFNIVCFSFFVESSAER